MRLLDASGRTLADQSALLPAAVDGGVWSATTLELRNADPADVVLVLESQPQPATVAVPRVLWGAPEALHRSPRNRRAGGASLARRRASPR